MSHIRYRRDIDGLRTLAVVPVVLFHAELPPFSGGFLGVDIFFVISGFLITSGLLKDVDAGAYSLLRFYDRRIRRILPALTAVLFATLVYGSWVMLPGELVGLAQSAASAAAFSSNIWFWSSVDYFGPAPYESPLLHTWSLAVEEQFYIFWPLIVSVFAMKRLRRFFLPALVAALLVSLAAAELSVRRYPDFAFYMFPVRAWELLIGALLAAAPAMRIEQRLWRTLAAVAGLLLVLLPMFLYTAKTPFPGLSAVPVCVGTALMLLANASQDNLVARAFGWEPMVFIGRLSYSLYLWHWPIIAFYWLQSGHAPPPAVGTLLVGASLVCAFFSWKYVEAPFRKPSAKRGASRNERRTVLLGGVAVAAVVGCSAVLIAAKGLPARLPSAALTIATYSPEPFTPPVGCVVDSRKEARTCAEGVAKDTKSTVLLWGDSHARALGFGLSQLATENGIALRTVVKSGCAPLPGTLAVAGPGSFKVLSQRSVCFDFNARMVRAIEASESIKVVVIAARWARFLGDNVGDEVEAATARTLIDREHETRDARTTAIVLKNSLRAELARLTASGKKVVLVQQAPSFPFSPRKCVARAAWSGGDRSGCTIRASELRARRSGLTQLLQEVAAQPGVALIDPLDLMCPRGLCVAEQGGLPLYVDNHHVTKRGSEVLTSAITLDMLTAAH